MRIRVVHRPDNHWVVEKKVLFWWAEVERFYQWTYGGTGAQEAALRYAELMVNPTIIEVK